MTREVVFLNHGTSYFNMKKFEASIENRGIERQKRIAVKKKIIIVDRIIMCSILILFTACVIMFTRVGIQQIKTITKNNEILKLTEEYNAIKRSNDEISNGIKNNLKYDNLKMKAYMELNMITPTEKNIIYFDKSDSEYVRQYENIK